jgi:hypothetical protein
VPSGIDHVVIVVNDLASATKSFESLGFTVSFGGHHEHRPSSNALIPFADGSYIELVGFRPHPEPIVDPWWTLLETGEGLADHALRTERVAEDVARLTSQGFSARGPIAGGRNRPDGERVDWQIARIDTAANARPPFIIEDITARDLRVPDGALATHVNGVDRIAGVTTVVASIDPAKRLYDAVTGQSGEPVTSSINAAASAVRYSLGNQWLELVQPAGGSSPLRDYLELRGSGPYEFTLGSGTDSDTELQVAHGARIRLPHS